MPTTSAYNTNTQETTLVNWALNSLNFNTNLHPTNRKGLTESGNKISRKGGDDRGLDTPPAQDRSCSWWLGGE